MSFKCGAVLWTPDINPEGLTTLADDFWTLGGEELAFGLVAALVGVGSEEGALDLRQTLFETLHLSLKPFITDRHHYFITVSRLGMSSFGNLPRVLVEGFGFL